MDGYRRAACSGDGCGPQGTRQGLLASGTKRSLSRLLRPGTTDNNGMSHHGYSDSTISSPRFPLSGGSGFEEPIRAILRQSLGADVKEKLSKGFPVGDDPLPQLTVGIPLHVEEAANWGSRAHALSNYQSEQRIASSVARFVFDAVGRVDDQAAR